jgi:hypothetical protein
VHLLEHIETDDQDLEILGGEGLLYSNINGCVIGGFDSDSGGHFVLRILLFYAHDNLAFERDQFFEVLYWDFVAPKIDSKKTI